MQGFIINILSSKQNKVFFKSFYSKNTTIPKLKQKIIFNIHCGHYWKQFKKIKLMSGRKLGAFSFTKKNYQYYPKKKIKK